MYIFGDIDTDMAEKVVTAIDQGDRKPIWICSAGGDLNAAFAIYDAIVDKGITVIGTGNVGSSGVLILMAGDTRYATPNTRFLTHAVAAEGATITDEIESEVACMQDSMARVYNERCSIPLDLANWLMLGTHYFGVEEATKLNFISGEYVPNDHKGF